MLCFGLSSLICWKTASLGWNLESFSRRQRILEGVHICPWRDSSAGLLISSPLLFSFSDLKNQMSRIISGFCDCARSGKDYFLLRRGLKHVLCLLEYLLTPATILCLAILENANAFSVRVAGFKHKIYR
jgi:hypothetical protein